MPERARASEVDRLHSEAWQEAKALGNHWVGTEHLFLALLASTEGHPATVTLTACGLEHDAFAQALRNEISDPPQDPPEPGELGSPSPTPAMYTVMGRAEGLAAGFGAPDVTVEHVLIALLWDPSTSVYQEEFFGVTREAILGELSHLGVTLPHAPLPPRPPASGERIFVPYGDVMSVVGALLARLPSSGVGFNHDAKSRAWVSAYATVDLAPHVQAVLDELGLAPVAQ
jgi:hypothetical protein